MVDAVKPETLEEFCALRDKIFSERKERIAQRHAEERQFFDKRPWEKSVSLKAADKSQA